MSAEKRGETFVMREPEEEGPIGFTTFLAGFATSALIHLGVSVHPDTGKVAKDLPSARQTLDALSMLREKTRGNLTVEEDRFFENLLTELRIRYLEATKS
jgi:Domain of unknown function (DUF1844)